MELPAEKRKSFSQGWALGSDDWKKELIKLFGGRPESAPRAEYLEPREMQVLRWQTRLQELMRQMDRQDRDLKQTGRVGRWKIDIADRMRREMGVPIVWLATALKTGRPASLRTMLWRRRQTIDK